MPDIELGQNYSIEEDSNGDLVITDGDGTPVMTHDDSADTWTLADSTAVNDLTDATSGANVYDTGTEAVTADVDNEKVSTDKLSNAWDHVVNDEAELAEALADARDNPDVKIRVGSGEMHPANNISLPVSLSSGTVIKGMAPSRAGYQIDGFSPTQGTRLHGDGNVLFDLTDESGMVFEDFAPIESAKFVEAGASTTDGISYSTFRNLYPYGISDYVFDLYNTFNVGLHNITAVGDTGFCRVREGATGAAGVNSTWSDITFTGTSDTASSAMYFEANGTNLNYLTILRPQVISAAETTASGAAAIELQGSGDDLHRAQFFTILGADLEGDYQHMVRLGDDTQYNYINVAGTAGVPEDDIRAQPGSFRNMVVSMNQLTAYNDGIDNWFMGQIDTSVGPTPGYGVQKKNEGEYRIRPGVGQGIVNSEYTEQAHRVFDNQGLADATEWSVGYLHGFFTVKDYSNNRSGLFHLDETDNNVTTVSDPAGYFLSGATNRGTDGSVNVYWWSGDLTVENQTGGAIDVAIHMFE